MTTNPTIDLSNNELSAIRDAVPALDLVAIRSLRRAGFQIVRQSDRTDGRPDESQAQKPDWAGKARPANPAT